eukprot:CAMPEP_0172911174 /NCGR_PEP_ID=MMETSP1075-20121228/185996_1 /TAXON_ID=2916 /ORGANISM="Ceratium fusus, Strain PA161109" /LENGTH=89 /DNA_ID=CAMNT_0013769437 /DNA_START=12 /DNA_END=278 /DNA_ORIENTATION=+
MTSRPSLNSEAFVEISRSSLGCMTPHDEMTEFEDILIANRQVKRMRRIKAAQVVASLGEFKCIKMFAKNKNTVGLLVDSFVGIAIVANS